MLTNCFANLLLFCLFYSHDDVVRACKMLHNHFSGEKPLKQQQMVREEQH